MTYIALTVSVIQIQRRLCNRQVIRRQAVREDGRALFPSQGEAAAAWHRGVFVQLCAVRRHERAGYVTYRIDGVCGRGLLDECFADLTGVPGSLTQLGHDVRAKVLRCTGIPVGVGIARTKTLAKLANHTAKRLQVHTGGVVDITDDFKRDWVLRNTEVKEVWGIGRKMTVHLEALGIRTAMDLAKADPRMLREKFSVVVEKTARELAGTPCLELDEADPPKQEICCSRMFGKRMTELTPIKQAAATYAARAAEKLRAQGSVCKRMRVSIRTGMFNPNEMHLAKGALVELTYPTNDTLLLTRAATEAVEKVYQDGYRYSKAKVLLMDLRQPGEFTDDLFAMTQPVACDRLMSVLDKINGKYGRGTMRTASVPRTPDWGMRREMMSRSYTTRIDQLWQVYCK